MRGKQVLGVAFCASLVLGATACGDDDDDAATETTTTEGEAQGPTSIEVTLTSDGFDGLPSELPAGLVEITIVNETDGFASLDISRVTAGTTEDEFVEGLAPLFEGGEFPDFFESNVGVGAEGGETGTSLVTMRAGEHIAWYEASSGEGADDGEETGSDTETEAEGPAAPDVVTAALTVTAGDDSAELPEADGEIVATDYEFEVDLDGPGTVNFRNEGPQQFHHAVVVDFGTNDPEAVEEAFPAILESEGDPSALPEAGDLEMDEVDFEFGGSGVFGPDGVAGTFEADITEGNTYVVVCFIQDRTGGPPHAIAYDMWDVVQVGGDSGSTTTTDG